MVMAEEISRLVDGELDPDQVDAVCRRLRGEEAMSTWVAYHVIGDVLRDSGTLSPGFSQRFARRLAAEPTVLAPPRREVRSGTFRALAVAASAAAVAVVGWAALQVFQPGPPELAATAPVASAAPAGARQAVATGPTAASGERGLGGNVGEYLLVHQEYSPATMIQGVQPFIRAVSFEDGPAR
jgi:sigma-E factor negative regulatory protein RseA